MRLGDVEGLQAFSALFGINGCSPIGACARMDPVMEVGLMTGRKVLIFYGRCYR